MASAPWSWRGIRTFVRATCVSLAMNLTTDNFEGGSRSPRQRVIELLRWIRESSNDCAIFLANVSSGDDKKAACIRFGADHFLDFKKDDVRSPDRYP